MKHIRKAEYKLSETVVYRYFVGGLLFLFEVLEAACKWLIKHMTELLILMSVIGMLTAANAFNSNVINYTTSLLFIVILTVLIAALIKILILENKK